MTLQRYIEEVEITSDCPIGKPLQPSSQGNVQNERDEDTTEVKEIKFFQVSQCTAYMHLQRLLAKKKRHCTLYNVKKDCTLVYKFKLTEDNIIYTARNPRQQRESLVGGLSSLIKKRKRDFDHVPTVCLFTKTRSPPK